MRLSIQKALWLSVVFLFACSETGTPQVNIPAAETRRELTSGSVIGFVDTNDTYAWLGLPYAKAPVGDLRWRAPRPVESWSGVKQALAFQNICPQLGGPGSEVGKEQYGQPVGSEDCLFLNVWSPKTAVKNDTDGRSALPVMVWIHGGGNSIGTANSYRLARNLAGKQNVVVVTINYRLGILGWFRHSALRSDEGIEGKGVEDNLYVKADASGNYGTLDIIQSLRWVKNNIRAFGGDPDNVTIFGESAGGYNVYSMLLSPLSEGLFHKAISQSGGVKISPLTNSSDSLNLSSGKFVSGEEFAIDVWQQMDGSGNKNRAREWFAESEERDIARWLRGLPVDELYEHLKPFSVGMGMVMLPQLFGDGYVLPEGEAASLLADSNAFHPVPLITGTNRDEMKLFMLGDPEYVKSWFGLIPRMIDPEDYQRMAYYSSNLWRIYGADQPATALTRAHPDVPVYVYRFDFDQLKSNWLVNLSELIGAGHGQEINYVFGEAEGLSKTFNVHKSSTLAERQKLADAMSSYWANFAYTGKPGRGRHNDLPLWQPWHLQTSSAKALLIDADNRGGIRHTDDELTIAELKKQMLSDTVLMNDSALLCSTYNRVFRDGKFGSVAYDTQEYTQLREAGCVISTP